MASSKMAKLKEGELSRTCRDRKWAEVWAAAARQEVARGISTARAARSKIS